MSDALSTNVIDKAAKEGAKVGDAVVVGVLLVVAVVVLGVVIFIMRKLAASVKEAFAKFVPIKAAADALHAKLLFEKEQITNNPDLEHDKLDTLIEVFNKLFDEWIALVKRTELVERKAIPAGNALLMATSAVLPGPNLDVKIDAVGKFITSAVNKCQGLSDSFSTLAHRSQQVFIDASFELDWISTTRAGVLRECELNEDQYDTVTATDREIYKLKLKILRYLTDAEDLHQQLGFRSVRDQVRDQMAAAHGGTDLRQVELLLAGQ